MLTIKKDDTVLTVTVGAFKGVYKSLGFRPVSGGSIKSPFTDRENVPPNGNTVLEDDPGTSDSDINEDADDEEDLSEIPFGEMNFKQLKAYARQLGIDITGITDKRELRKVIRNISKN